MDLSLFTPAQWHILLGFVFAFGLCVGSFLNVVIYRLPLEQSVVHPRSRCPSCGKLIPWYRNVPVLSWLVLRAKCGDCGAAISARYPLVEILTAVLFTAAAAREPSMLAWPVQFLFLGSVLACVFIDLDHWILPDKITLPGIVIGFLTAPFVHPGEPLDNLLTSGLGLLFGGGSLYFVALAYKAYAKKDGMGGGDIKFLAMVGAFLGLRGALITLFLSSILGSILGLFLILFRGKKGSTAIPFGPYLALGAFAAFFFGEALWQWYFGML
jgi:leader peptidase (prepilin peptidase) / N-methyltransferase